MVSTAHLAVQQKGSHHRRQSPDALPSLVRFMTSASVTAARAFSIVALRSVQMQRAGHFAWRLQVFGADMHFKTETGPLSVLEMSRRVMSSGGLARRSPPPTPRSALMIRARFRGTASLLMNAAEMSCDEAIAPIVRGDSFCMCCAISRRILRPYLVLADIFIYLRV